MSVRATADFNLDAQMMIDAAFRFASGEQELDYELRSALELAQLLQIELEARSLPMWEVETFDIPLVATDNLVLFPDDADEILNCVLYNVNGAARIPIDRVGRDRYFQIPTPASPGQPVNIWVQRALQPSSNVGNVTGTLWPVPDRNNMWRLQGTYARFIRDVGSFTDSIDIPRRMIPVYVWGLAYYIAFTRPQISEVRRRECKQNFTEMCQLAARRDADQSKMNIAPDFSCYNRFP